MSETEAAGLPISSEQRNLLSVIRTKLLQLHKLLMEDQRKEYEQEHGRVESSGELLRLVMYHDAFSWLHSISELIVRIDETLDSKEPVEGSEADRLLRSTRTLLTASENGTPFQRKYYGALQREAGVIITHSEIRRLFTDS
jgi:hypothetical protein